VIANAVKLLGAGQYLVSKDVAQLENRLLEFLGLILNDSSETQASF
jgi:hypothetical protein